MTNFPAEWLFLESPPAYESERLSLCIKIFLAFVAWSLILPFFFAREVAVRDGEENGETSTSNTQTESLTKEKNTSSRQHRGKKKKRNATCETNKKHMGTNNPPEESSQKVIDTSTNLFCMVGLILHLMYLMLKSSPDNYYASRSVFETPLFTDSECQYLVDMAERVAQRNYESALTVNVTSTTTGGSTTTKIRELLEEPYGWQKRRHQSHPTTDLNLVTDPFSKHDREWLQNKLDSRLAPTLQRIFGVPPSSIRAKDIFVIRYDGDRQASLEKHTDSGSITFSVLLSDGFVGGGTRYYNRFANFRNSGALLDPDGDPFAFVLPEKGMMQTFPGSIQHEGVQTEDGRRYLLIGFLDVDRVDPWTGHPTGLSWFASWGSVNWVTTKVKSGWKELVHSTSHQLRELFMKLQEFFIVVGELSYHHRFVVLVNKTNSEEYLNELDVYYGQSRKSGSFSKGSWFSGQQIDVGFDGSFLKDWSSRNENLQAFEEIAKEQNE